MVRGYSRHEIMANKNKGAVNKIYLQWAQNCNPVDKVKLNVILDEEGHVIAEFTPR